MRHAGEQGDARARRDVYVLAALALCVFLVFGPSLGYPFVNYDDPHYVINNYSVQQGFTLEAIAWAFTTGYAENWHPLTWLSHMLDFQLYGMRPGAHRFTNVLLHLASACVLFAALRRLTGAHWRSAAVAGLFAVHPLHVESVIWIAERKDVLSGLFWMLTLWCYAHWRERPSTVRYATLLAVFALGLMAKSMLVTLPCVLLLLDVWPLRRLQTPLAKTAGRLVLEKAPLFALSAVFSVVTFLVQDAGGTMKTLGTIPLWARAANAVIAYGAYLWKTIWPVELAVLYPHPGTAIPWFSFAAALLALIAISLAALVWRKRAPYVAIGWLWYLGTLVPVIGLVQVGDQAYADRYTYLPLIGVFIAVVWGAAALWERFGATDSLRLPVYACAMLTAVLVALAGWQTRYWSSSIALFERCVAVTTENGAAYNNLGRAYHDAGRLEEAAHAYRTALEHGPHLHMARNNLALIALNQQNYAAAETLLRDALAAGAGDARIHLNLGIALAAQGRTAEAAAAMRNAVERMPSLVPARYSLGVLLAEQGQRAEAIRHLETVLALQHNHREAQAALARVTR